MSIEMTLSTSVVTKSRNSNAHSNAGTNLTQHEPASSTSHLGIASAHVDKVDGKYIEGIQIPIVMVSLGLASFLVLLDTSIVATVRYILLSDAS
jgi:hypothetical protein